MNKKELEDYAKQFEAPWGEIGYLVYKRTYSRPISEHSQDTEEFHQTIARVVRACETQLKCGFAEEEEKELTQLLMELKGSVAGRFMWQLGTKTVSKLGLASLQNCAACVIDEPIQPFTWVMDMLMLGVGCGVNIQKEHVYQIPKLQKKKPKIVRKDTASADYIVPDTREGWVKLLGKVLKSYFYSGEGFSYSTILIRGKGAPIKGFGGVASGAEILVEGIEEIGNILDKRRGKKLRPIDALDIVNIIGMIVVAGNIRRSAIIAIGDHDDVEYLKAKRWDLGNIPRWRSNSNNSVVCSDTKELLSEFWEGFNGNSEPYGLINLESSRKQGRLGETQYKDEDVICYNPCAEQSLNNYETCCLAEVHLPNITSYEEFIKVVKYLYRIAKHSLTLPCHHEMTEDIVHKNMRMGIGITGEAMATEEQRSWYDRAYKELREFDEEYSRENKLKTSIKITTCKPSGTLSLLSGVTPGAHPGYSEFYLRRVRLSSSSPLVNLCKEKGYPVEYRREFDGSEDYNTVVVSFPCRFPPHTTFAKDMSAVEQLETCKRLQSNWSDNSVSVTVYYRKEELPEIKKWLNENFENSLKTVSFLLHNEHGFDQAPLEEITEEEYNELVSKVEPISGISGFDESDVSDEGMECASGICPIK